VSYASSGTTVPKNLRALNSMGLVWPNGAYADKAPPENQTLISSLLGFQTRRHAMERSHPFSASHFLGSK
jgi:hypothetical protein